MIILSVLLFIVIVLISYLLFAPFYFEIDSTKELYRIRFHKIASMNVKFTNNSLVLEVKIAWWKKQIDLAAALETTSEEKAVATPKIRKKKKVTIQWKKIKGVLKSFKVKKCNISIGFENMQLNGIFYPLFFWISSYTEKNIRVNFWGENIIILQITNKLARMGWAYIRT